MHPSPNPDSPSTPGFWEQFHKPVRSSRLPRCWSNKILRKLGPLLRGDVINVSGWQDSDKEGGRYRDYFPNASSYTVSNYGGDRGTADPETGGLRLDLEGPVPPGLERRFDVVFNHTTLEHVFEVRAAFRNLCRLSKDIVVVVVPFAQEMHCAPSFGDYWRFTPMALRRLFAENGLEVVLESRSRYANAGVYLLFVGSRQPDAWRKRLPPYRPVADAGNWIGVTLLDGLVRRVADCRRATLALARSWLERVRPYRGGKRAPGGRVRSAAETGPPAKPEQSRAATLEHEAKNPLEGQVQG
jgi:hypothetical protein